MKIFVIFLSFASFVFATENSTEDPIQVVCQPSDINGQVYFVAHPYECSKFFMCQGYVGIPMHCPGELQFDADLKVCNYESVVHCENTPRPTPSTSTTTTEKETTTTEATTTEVETTTTTTVVESTTAGKLNKNLGQMIRTDFLYLFVI